MISFEIVYLLILIPNPPDIKSAPPDQFVSVQSCIQTCTDDVLLWMNSNKLKLNTDKTEVVYACWLWILSRSTVNAQTLPETVFRSKRLLNTSD